MNMCTVREIREAIQEDCRSQRDMESGISSTSSLKNTVVHNRYNERKGMNMCTVREIREAIQEDCRSQRDMESTEIQRDMESTEIDRVFQTLPFSQERDLFDKPPMPKRPYRRKKKDTDRP